MTTFATALRHALTGGLIERPNSNNSDAVDLVRTLGQDEADEILLKENPHRRIKRDKKGKIVEKKGVIQIEEIPSAISPRALGLYISRAGGPLEPFRPTEADQQAAWTRDIDKPKAVEFEPQSIDIVDTLPPLDEIPDSGGE